jgi:hypothetical protein
MSDRSALVISQGANIDPRVAQMQAQGPAGLLPLWQQLQLEVQAQTYSNVFLIAGIITLVGAFLALALRHGRPQRGESAEPIEM